jgi:hypothetical protein
MKTVPKSVGSWKISLLTKECPEIEEGGIKPVRASGSR